MKKLLPLLTLCFLLHSCTQKLSKEQSIQLWKAYKEQNYFRLHNLVAKINSDLNTPEVLLFKAKLAYVFNRPQESDSLINLLLDKHVTNFTDTIIADLHLMKAVNGDRVENYKSAFTEGTLVVEKFKKCCDSALIAETKDDNEVREALTGVPLMQIIKSTDVQVPLKRDIAGLMNLMVGVGNDSMNFVFDTGANISVMIASVAAKYGLKTSDKKVHIEAFTGKRLEAKMAYGDIKIGSIEIKNAVFIVFPDSVLTFGHGAYVIKGVIGFPIMNALKEIIVKDDKYLIVPQTPEKTTAKNFALDQSTPVILVKYNNDTIPLHFDTGADRTDFYVSFLNKYKNHILTNCKKKLITIGGAGGNIEVETYTLDKATLTAGNVETRLDSLHIFTKTLMANQDHLYGNFGQDFIKKYKVMKINFAAMNISFSN
jgi:predicted aspartyl protease